MNITSRGWACKCCPPSTSTVVPVMLGDSSKKRTVRATSCGVEVRASGFKRAVRFLLESPSITGTTVLVDGGQHLQAQPRDVMFLVRGTQT